MTNSKHGITQDERGQDQPTDKKRAQQADIKNPPGVKEQIESAKSTPQSPGEPANGE